MRHHQQTELHQSGPGKVQNSRSMIRTSHCGEADHANVRCSIRFDIQPGREGFVDFKSGQESIVYRAKNGHLMVVSLVVTVKCTGDKPIHW